MAEQSPNSACTARGILYRCHHPARRSRRRRRRRRYMHVSHPPTEGAGRGRRFCSCGDGWGDALNSLSSPAWGFGGACLQPTLLSSALALLHIPKQRPSSHRAKFLVLWPARGLPSMAVALPVSPLTSSIRFLRPSFFSLFF